MLNYLLFLSMVHEYAYFVMNIFGKRSIEISKLSESKNATRKTLQMQMLSTKLNDVR